MKRVITLTSLGVLLLLACGRAAHAVTVVQYVGAKPAGSTTTSSAFASNVTAGNTIVCVFAYSETTGAVSVTSIVGSVNGAYTAITGPTKTGTITAATYAKTSIAGGAETITITLSAGGAFGNLGCTEVSGDGSIVTGAINFQTSPGTTANAVTSGTTSGLTQAATYCAGLALDGDGGTAIGGGTGWSTGPADDSGLQYNWEDRTGVSSNLAATFTAGTGTDHFASVIICAQATGGGGGFVLRSQALLQGVGK